MTLALTRVISVFFVCVALTNNSISLTKLTDASQTLQSRIFKPDTCTDIGMEGGLGGEEENGGGGGGGGGEKS